MKEVNIENLDKIYKFGTDYLFKTLPELEHTDSSDEALDDEELLSDKEVGDEDVFYTDSEMLDLLPHRRPKVPPIPELSISEPVDATPTTSNSPYAALKGYESYNSEFLLHPTRPHSVLTPRENNAEKIFDLEEQLEETDESIDSEDETSTTSSTSSPRRFSSPSPDPLPLIPSPPRVSVSEPTIRPSPPARTQLPQQLEEKERPLDFEEFERRLNIIFGRKLPKKP